MARGTTPPGEMGKEATHGLPDEIAGAVQGADITEDMRQGNPKTELDSGPKRGERGEFFKATYPLAKKDPKYKGPKLFRMDR